MKRFFQCTEFDFNEAAYFISSAGFVAKKIKQIGIPTKTQKLLLSLREQDIYKLQKFERAKTDKIREILIDRIHEPSSRLPETVLEPMCAAFRCLLMANGSPVDASFYWKFLSPELQLKAPHNVLPWLKSRKALLTKLLGADVWEQTHIKDSRSR